MARRVLLVDDDPDVRRVTARLLESGGYEVYPASDADEARFALRAWRPDAVVTDLVGPGDVAGLARAALDAGVRVVLLSGSDPENLARTAGRLGAAAAVGKPCRRADLLAALVA
jgi:two-component system OmpR family response regulator